MSTLPPAAPPDPDLVVIDTAHNRVASLGALRGRGGKTALIIVIVLLIAELGARVLSGGLPDPDWSFAQTDRKVAEMEAMAAAGETANVVLIGNSSVNAAFVADELERLTGLETIYNAALDGSATRQTEDWTLNVVVPLTAPEMVVIGLTSRDLNDAAISNAEVFDKYLSSRGRARFLGEETMGQRVQRTLSDVSALVRISPFLRDPASLVTQYDPKGTFGGEYVLPGENYSLRPLDITRTRERALNDYALGGVELDSLTRLVEALETQGIEVIIIEMPYIAEDYLPLHPNGAADYEAYRATVAAFTSARGLPYIDLTDYPWTKSEFYDFLHVNSAGTSLVNAMLADALVAATYRSPG